MEKQKTIYDLDLHETMTVEEIIGKQKINPGKEMDVIKKYEVTRVPGGWVYSFDYPSFRQSPVVFVPLNKEFQI